VREGRGVRITYEGREEEFEHGGRAGGDGCDGGMFFEKGFCDAMGLNSRFALA
jgi:hypothetical protein